MAARLAAGLGVLLALGGCSTTAPSVPEAGSFPASTSGSGPAAVTGTDWPGYHRTADRAGYAAATPTPTALQPAWSARLDAAVYGQPLVIGGLVIAATEADTVYGLDRRTGVVRWRRALGRAAARAELPCGDIDPLGITGTPAYDAASGAVFVAAELSGARHLLVALDARSGAVRFTRSLDVTDRDPRAEQQRGALVVSGGRVYVPFGGLYGDCGDYVGYVAAASVDGSGGVAHYEVPTRREGGIWAPSGVAAAADGSIWVAVGNGAGTGGSYDGSDSVLRLTADLSRRLDYFAPADWGRENAADADLGSTGPLLTGTGRVLVSGKDGKVYLLDADHLGGIGGQLAALQGCTGFGGLAWDAGARAAFVPCTEGLLRVEVGDRSLSAGWRVSGVSGSPVVGGGTVWALDTRAGRLVALDEHDGHQLVVAAVGAVSRFASPVLSGRVVLVPTLAGVTALMIG